jgi:hypothetical protein
MILLFMSTPDVLAAAGTAFAPISAVFDAGGVRVGAAVKRAAALFAGAAALFAGAAALFAGAAALCAGAAALFAAAAGRSRGISRVVSSPAARGGVSGCDAAGAARLACALGGCATAVAGAVAADEGEGTDEGERPDAPGESEAPDAPDEVEAPGEGEAPDAPGEVEAPGEGEADGSAAVESEGAVASGMKRSMCWRPTRFARKAISSSASANLPSPIA